jgi:SAM-dependent methyltransferase
VKAASHWEVFSTEWIDWVRTPDHDAFWMYLDEFRNFVPPAGTATCEIGCGEGRISRELTSLGHRVTGVDLSPSLLASAQEANSAERYVLADATALPFPDGHFDRVVAYNVLMDVPDLGAATAEAARVLAPNGILTISIVHPFTDLGAFDEVGRFVLHGNYFECRPFAAVERSRGLTMHWDGWSRPLRDYVGALRSAGLVVEDLYEPVPAQGLDDEVDGRVDDWRRLPLFLWLNVRHGAPVSRP